MDITETDIAALEKILHQAQDWMLEERRNPDQASEEQAEARPGGEMHGEESGKGEPEALEVEIDAPEPKFTALGSHRFAAPPPSKRAGRSPVGRKGRY